MNGQHVPPPSALPAPARRALTSALPWCALVAMVAMWAFATNTNATERPRAVPTSIAIVDFGLLFDNLEEVTASNAALDTKLEPFRTDLKAAEERAKQLTDEQDLLVRMSNDWIKVTRELAELNGMGVSTGNMYKEMILKEGAITMRETYAKALVEIERIAKAEGYDLVMYSDVRLFDPNATELLQDAVIDQINTLIVNRRIMYHSDSIDITSRVATAMNNAFQAGR